MNRAHLITIIDDALGECLDFGWGVSYDDGPALAEFIADRLITEAIKTRAEKLRE